MATAEHGGHAGHPVPYVVRAAASKLTTPSCNFAPLECQSPTTGSPRLSACSYASIWSAASPVGWYRNSPTIILVNRVP